MRETSSGPLPEGPAPWPRASELAGYGVRLTPSSPREDALDLHGPTHGSPGGLSTWDHLAYGPFGEVEDLEAWLHDGLASRDPVYFIVRTGKEGRAVGHVSYLRIRPERRCLEIGHIWYVPSVRRTHVNTAAAFLLLDDAFQRGYRRVEWRCHHRNVESRRAALRLGFRFEGSLRQHMVAKGENRDTLTFSILDKEWPRLRGVMAEWLGAAPGERGSLGRRVEELDGDGPMGPGVGVDPRDRDRRIGDVEFTGARLGLTWVLTQEDDLDGILTLEADPELGAHLNPWSAAQHRRAMADPRFAHLGVRDADGGSWLGYVILNWHEDDPGVELVRVAVAEPGRGVGRRILLTLANDVLRRLAQARLWLKVLPGNDRALSLYRSLGFQQEGYLRAALRRPSGMSDVIVLSRLAGDPGPWE